MLSVHALPRRAGEGEGAPERFDEDALGAPIAWENRGVEGEGWLLRLWRTLRAILLSPTAFFRALDSGDLGSSFSFAAIVLLPAIIIHTLLAYLVVTVPELRTASGLPRPSAHHMELTRRVLIIVPITAVLFVVYVTTFYQAASAIASGRRPAIRATIRGTCFGFAPMVVAVIPLVGLCVGFVWSLVLHAIALRELHGLGRLQAMAVVTVPQLVIMLRFAYA